MKSISKCLLVNKNVTVSRHQRDKLAWINGDIEVNNPIYHSVCYKTVPYCYFMFKKVDLFTILTIGLINFKHRVELVNEICKYIFSMDDTCQKVCIYLLEEDWFGKKLVENSEFLMEVRMRQHYKLNGKIHDYLLYSKFRQRTNQTEN